MKAPALSAGTREIEKGMEIRNWRRRNAVFAPRVKNAIRPPAAVKTESQIGTIDLLETE